MPDSQSSARDQAYTVVARRYRPQQFADLVGQEHVVTALNNAILQKRVGHAYLFTGARGTGKTSAARIFAKCLNCASGPTPVPCNQCDICQLVSTGEDVDVIEIDGASNRGIDEIRELRSNAAVRPSRGRFKIYIIDEVHMLTREAFNALLKTLEEPPPHVKFLFCTTDPQKIPITVLSRCQRFDFRPVDSPSIAARLAEIAAAEGVTAEPAAIELLARRAAGSMRDSQSLLEQLLAACDGELTVAKVQSLLGLSDQSAIAAIFRQILDAAPGLALQGIHAAIRDGADAGRLAQQLVAYARDVMALRTGCDESVLLALLPADCGEARELAGRVELEQLLAILQVLDAGLVQMQSSAHGRILLEAAVVRASTLGGVVPVGRLLAAVRGAPMDAVQPAGGQANATNGAGMASGSATGNAPQGSIGQGGAGQPGVSDANQGAGSTSGMPPASDSAAGAKEESGQAGPKKKQPAGETPAAPPAADLREAALIPPSENGRGSPREPGASASPPGETAHEPVGTGPDASEARRWWNETVSRLSAAGEVIVAEMAGRFRQVQPLGAGRLSVTLEREIDRRLCSEDARRRRLESTLAEVAGMPVRLEFRCDAGEPAPPPPAAVRVNRALLLRQIEQNPFVRSLVGKFDAEITGFEPAPAPRAAPPREEPATHSDRTARVEQQH